MAAIDVRLAPNAVISRTTPAVSFIDNPVMWSGAGWSNAKASLAQAVGAYKTHIYPFGLLDPWASDINGKTESDPSLWATGNRLDKALTEIRACDANAPIILTLYSAPWFTKTTLWNNTHTPLTYADRFSDDGRVTADGLADWLTYVDEAVQRAAASPYNCRDFEVWNEGKGYYATGASNGVWDATMNAGTGSNGDMGYSYFYQQTAAQIVATMTGLSIARDQYRISGPYPVLSGRGVSNGSSIGSGHPLYAYREVWGYANAAPITFTQDFLGHARDEGLPLDVLSLDTSTFLQDATYPTADPFDPSSKFAPITAYWRDQLDAYGFDADLPIDYSEIYAFPPPDLQTAGQETLRAAIWADCLTQCVMTRVRYPMMWGAVGSAQGSNSDEGGLITDPRDGASAGQLTRVGEITRDIKTHFGPGARVFALQGSDAIGGMATEWQTLLYNKTDAAVTVALRGWQQMELDAYETKLVGTPVRWPYQRR